jgi:cytochrome c oxidase assembly factor CtaG
MTAVPWAVLYLVSGCLGCTVLGILLAFAPSAVHAGMREIAAADQHTGGLIMWVPGCLVYLAAVIAMFARWYSTPEDAPVLGRDLPHGSQLT